MPLTEGGYGTQADGSASSEYCKSCFENGAFTEPELKIDDMIKKSIRHMVYTLKMNDETADHLARIVIPTLKRWRSGGL